MNTRKCGAALVTLVTLVMLVLAGCGEGTESRRDGGENTTPPESTSAEPTATTSESPTEAESSPTIEPATGKVIKVEEIRARVPEGWITSIRLPIQQGAFPSGVLYTFIRVFHFPNSGLFTIDELGDVERKTFGSKGKRLDDLVIDGQQVYHLTGNPDRGHAERFGSIVNDAQVFIEFQFGAGQGRAARDEIIQSVLATVQFG